MPVMRNGVWRFYISNWQKTRMISIEGNQIGLQVTLESCYHCNACQARVKSIKQTLSRKPDIKPEWKFDRDGCCWVFVPITDVNDPINSIRNTLELSVE